MLDAIRKRRSVRSYRSDEVPDKAIEELIKAAQFAPNSHHLRCWEFIVIRDKNIKKELYKIVHSPYLESAPVLIIPVTDIAKTSRPIQDLSVASENIFTQASEMGLGTVWKNITEDKRPEIKKLLGIPENFILVNIIPVGYPEVLKRPHNDGDFKKEKMHFEKW